MALRTVAAARRGGGRRPRGRRASSTRDDRGGTSSRGARRVRRRRHPPLTPAFVSRFLQSDPHRRSDVGAARLAGAVDGRGGRERGGRGGARERSASRSRRSMMANSITSLRAIAPLDWKSFVERQSAMEAVLRAGSGRRLRAHDVRDARPRTGTSSSGSPSARSARSVEVADAADRARARVARLRAAGRPGARPRRLLLIDDGLATLERATGYRPTLARRRCTAGCCGTRTCVFIGGIVAVHARRARGGAAGSPAWPPTRAGAAGPRAAVRASSRRTTIAVERGEPARHGVPAAADRCRSSTCDGRDGIPPELPHRGRRAHAVRQRRGGARGARAPRGAVPRQPRGAPALRACSATSPTPTTETQPDDDAIVAAAVEGVRALNARYARGRDGRRSTCSTGRAAGTSARACGWAGSASAASWPSSTGSCAAARRDAFSTIVGDVDAAAAACATSSRSTPTRCCRPTRRRCWSARSRIRSTAPCYDPARGRVVRGYGILQPRVGVSLPSAHRSRFAAIHSGHPGRRSVHDGGVRRVPGPLRRRELHRQGHLRRRCVRAGDARPLPREHAALARPDRGQLRARRARHRHRGLRRLSRRATSRYTRRKHRWIRGDWQLLPWLTRARARARRAASATGSRCSRAGRSSTTCAAASSRSRSSLLLVAGWTVLPGLAAALDGARPARRIAAPWIVVAAARRRCGRRSTSRGARTTRRSARDAATSAQQVALAIAFLPHQAWISADAIVRTLWRLLVSRPPPARVADGVAGRSAPRSGRARDVWRAMWPAVALGASSCSPSRGARSAARHAGSRVAARRWRSLPLVAALAARADDRARAERAGARRRPALCGRTQRATRCATRALHWAFFERFVTAETNWLAPDNFQDDPAPVVAMRTSPTNIGLQLLATVSAHDLGFITLERDDRRGSSTRSRTLERMRALPRPLLQLVRPARPARARAGRTSPRWTAATSPGTCIALRQACLGAARARARAARARVAARVARAARGALRRVEMDFALPVRRRAQAVRDRLPAALAHARRVVVRPARVRGAARELRRDRQERRAGRALVPARPHAHARSGGATALVSWSGSMFEYLMPVLVMRVVPVHAARPDVSRRGASGRSRTARRAACRGA